MKLKDAGKTIGWRDQYMHHKDFVPSSRFKRWRRLSNHVREQGEVYAKEAIGSRYPGAVLKSFEDAMKRCPTISVDPDLMDGQPCIAKTRIPVRAVLRALEQYGSIDEVRRCYPHLTKDQVEDALYFSQVILELPSGLEETETAP
jgi:uncharacterized protein (DUF433 family)